ncbi:MAG: urease accessory protein UreD [bacterium]|nr:urease accessory protein UreD [bacterium]
MSSYGGGLVEGDDIRLSVHCKSNATLYLSTQAFTKIYKNPSGIPSRQRIRGTLSEEACAVVLPDPVVPYANSIFHQDQHWTLKPGALLILADGHTSGRYACGERFAYTEYISNITVSTEKRPILIERYRSHPATLPTTAPGRFGPFNTAFNLYIVGDIEDPRFTRITSHLKTEFIPHIAPSQTPSDIMISCTNPKPNIFIARALVYRTGDLTPLLNTIGQALPGVLGANPLERKY